MKKLVLLGVLVMFVAGCHRTPDILRTGSICVQPTMSDDFKTNDYVTVTSELAKRASKDLVRELKRSIANDTKMQVSECGASDYELLTSFNSIDVENKQYNNGWTGQKMQLNHYRVNVASKLKSKYSAVEELRDASTGGTDIGKIMESLGNEITGNIKKVKQRNN